LADVYPTLTYGGFDVDTFTYTYNVTCPSDMTWAFGQLVVQAEVPEAGIYAGWGLGASPEPASNWFGYSEYRDESGDNAIWLALEQADVIEPGTAWSGTFTLTVPNSEPKEDGLAVTMDGGPGSSHSTTVYVPGPGGVIPEPSSLLALGALAGGLIPLVRRRRRE
jgi:hypothetical protein